MLKHTLVNTTSTETWSKIRATRRRTPSRQSIWDYLAESRQSPTAPTDCKFLHCSLRWHPCAWLVFWGTQSSAIPPVAVNTRCLQQRAVKTVFTATVLQRVSRPTWAYTAFVSVALAQTSLPALCHHSASEPIAFCFFGACVSLSRYEERWGAGVEYHFQEI